MIYYIFDGSYNGYLSAFFAMYENKEFNAIPSLEEDMGNELFSQKKTIHTDPQKAARIIKSLEKILGKHTTALFFNNFLSEDRKAWLISFRLMIQIFKGNHFILKNYGHADSLYFSDILKKVSRERHRMKAFIRFQKDEHDLYSAIIDPDFNVLPLIVRFFQNRYADQQWIIFDVKRNYGYHYDLRQVHEIIPSSSINQEQALAVPIDLDAKEPLYQLLWKTYFKSTNIESRKNLKLHIQHVPKRYWKYLVEKQD
ncbi:TIGR03915 family putative DNA repair protein [Sphingobacterium sp. HJSM2_6]|uniref:TIGR03915 family putative DNA repair protein n=1 Tax=Sphingobacterium sp. HJSM2_6 TaxID=3366264 RepID=UPI003BCB4DEB